MGRGEAKSLLFLRVADGEELSGRGGVVGVRHGERQAGTNTEVKLWAGGQLSGRSMGAECRHTQESGLCCVGLDARPPTPTSARILGVNKVEPRRRPGSASPRIAMAARRLKIITCLLRIQSAPPKSASRHPRLCPHLLQHRPPTRSPLPQWGRLNPERIPPAPPSKPRRASAPAILEHRSRIVHSSSLPERAAARLASLRIPLRMLCKLIWFSRQTSPPIKPAQSQTLATSRHCSTGILLHPSTYETASAKSFRVDGP